MVMRRRRASQRTVGTRKKACPRRPHHLPARRAFALRHLSATTRCVCAWCTQLTLYQDSIAAGVRRGGRRSEVQRLREGSWADLDGDENLAKARASRVRSRTALTDVDASDADEDAPPDSSTKSASMSAKRRRRYKTSRGMPGPQAGRLIRCKYVNPSTGRKCGATARSVAAVRQTHTTRSLTPPV